MGFVVDGRHRSGAVALALAVIASPGCRKIASDLPEKSWVGSRNGVFASLAGTESMWQVIEIRGNHFRYRQHCDPDPGETPFLSYPVQGTVDFDGSRVHLRGPSGWHLVRQLAHAHGVDMLLSLDAFDDWEKTGSMPLLRVTVRVDGATFEDVDSKRLSLRGAKVN